jgi:hypothetical protein
MAQAPVVRWYFDPVDGIARNAKTGAKLTTTRDKIKTVFEPGQRPAPRAGRVYDQVPYNEIEAVRNNIKAQRQTPMARTTRAITRNLGITTRLVNYRVPEQTIPLFPKYTRPNPKTGARIGDYRVGSSTDAVLRAYNRVMAAQDKFPMTKANRTVMNSIYNQELARAVAAAPEIYQGQRGNFEVSAAERRKAERARARQARQQAVIIPVEEEVDVD